MIDLTYLTAMMDGDEKLAKKFLLIFQNQAPRQIKELRLQFETCNWEAFSITTHSLKSQFEYLNLTSLALKMSNLENLADEKQYHHIERLLEETEAEVSMLFAPLIS